MANVLNRTTKVLLTSANTVDYLPTEWIINPDLSAVVGFASKYWIISGDIVSLMSQAQRDAVDAAELTALRDAIVSEISASNDFVAAFVQVAIDEFNMHASRITSILDAVDAAATLAALKTSVAAIADIPQRTATDFRNAVRNKLGA